MFILWNNNTNYFKMHVKTSFANRQEILENIETIFTIFIKTYAFHSRFFLNNSTEANKGNSNSNFKIENL